MKKTLFTICAMAFLFCSCEKEMTAKQDGGAVQFTATQSGSQSATRAADGAWALNDQIGIFTGASDLDKSNSQYYINNSATGAMSAVSKPEVIYPSQGTQNYYAYYPYNAAQTTTTYNVDLTGQGTLENLTTIDLLWAKAENIEDESVPLHFAHQTVKLNISLTAEGLNINDADAVVTLIGADTKGDFDILTGTHSSPTKEDVALKICVDNNDTSKATITALVLPMTSPSGVVINVKLGTRTYMTPITTTTGWEKGNEYDYDIKIKELALPSPVIGDYYYSNKTYSAEFDVTKTVIGIIFYIDPVDKFSGKIVSMDEPEEKVVLTTSVRATKATNKIDGLANMAKVWDFGWESFSKYPPFEWVHDKNPLGTIYTSGQKDVWYLPAISELKQIYVNLNAISSKISIAGGTGLAIGDGNYDNYWSSTEKTSNNGYSSNFKDGKEDSNYKSNRINVRGIRAF